MPYCAVLECKNDSRFKNITHGGISYHRFPNDPYQKEKWIDATGRQNWMPTKTSTICSEHFIQNDITITPKGYRFLISTAVPTQKIMTVINQTNEGSRMCSGLPQKIEADIYSECDETELFTKKNYNCNTSIETSYGIVQYLPGPSRTQDSIEIDNYHHAAIDVKKPQMADNTLAHDEIFENSSNVLKEEAVEICDEVLQKKKRAVCVAVVSKKMCTDEDALSPVKKWVSDTNIVCHPKSLPMASNIQPGSTYSSPRNQKLSAMLRWSKSKIKYQTIKIKLLQTQVKRLKIKLAKAEDILKELCK